MPRDRLAIAGLAAGLLAPVLLLSGLLLWARPDLAPGVPGPSLTAAGVALLAPVALAVTSTSARHGPARPADPLAAPARARARAAGARSPRVMQARAPSPAHAKAAPQPSPAADSQEFTVVRTRRSADRPRRPPAGGTVGALAAQDPSNA